MKLGKAGTSNFERFQLVINELEKLGATIMVLAYVPPKGEIDYTIQARWPTGTVWEIVKIEPC